MKFRLFLCTLLVLSLSPAWACTSLMVGKNASADGSVICTYNADSWGTFRSLLHFPAATHPAGTMRDVINGDSKEYLGQIPEAPVTYAVMGNINEWQVTIGETTFGGRPELRDSTGLLDYRTLMELGLQRGRTAREALDVMTSMAERYGYCSTGQSFSICDPNEAWIMEMHGCGAGSKAVVWVAIRIPDNAICAHANQSRIRTFDQRDKQNVRFSANCISFARQRGYFSGKDSEFSFCDAYAIDNFRARRFCEARVWACYNRFADNFDRYLPFAEGRDLSAEPMPLWIVPNRKVELTDVFAILRDHYENTPLSLTQPDDPGRGWYDTPYRPTPLTYDVDGQTYFNERPISTQQSAFSWIAQMRGWLPCEVGGLMWWANDDGNMAAYVPVYCRNARQPDCFNTPNADCVTFSRDNAYWVCNWVANMVYPRYSLMYPAVAAVRDSLQNSWIQAQADIERRAAQLADTDPQRAIGMLTDYSQLRGKQMIQRWNTLAEYLIVKYNDMVVRAEADGKFKRTRTGFKPIVEKPGIPAHIKRDIATHGPQRLKMPPENKP